MKVSLLQGSFVHEIWSRIGKQAYLEVLHPIIISNLCVTSHTGSTVAASVLLIGSCEELGIPITVHQVYPNVLLFYSGTSSDVSVRYLFSLQYIQANMKLLFRHFCL